MELATRKLDCGYPGHSVGHGADLSVRAGGVLSLLGLNGSGKATLFKTLPGLLPRQGGAITLDGVELSRLSRSEIAHRLACVHQVHEAVFPYSVQDMVLLGRTVHRGPFASPRKADRKRAEQALGALGVTALGARTTRASAADSGSWSGSPEPWRRTPPSSSWTRNPPRVSISVIRYACQGRHGFSRQGLGVVLSTHHPDHALRCATRVALLKDGRTLGAGPPANALAEEALKRVDGVAVGVE